ncbi:MAG: hypothetical protein A2Z97_06845 [Bdellovibrionales bacterium GWB1_52_6]|nr:MAG: hypothetical protein A2Z97_06845 [Bdellovibrionales bacterium GWB1_52_6]
MKVRCWHDSDQRHFHSSRIQNVTLLPEFFKIGFVQENGIFGVFDSLLCALKAAPRPGIQAITCPGQNLDLKISSFGFAENPTGLNRSACRSISDVQ